jgi:NADH:ubiquinone oxidoreductase subunit 2 (subunit N)
MMVVAALPIAIVLVTGLLIYAVERTPGGSIRSARVPGASGAALALIVTLFLWTRGVRGAAGTLDADPFSLYCSALLLAVLLLVLTISKLSSAGISKLLFSTAPILMVISTRDLLWIAVALTVLTMSLLRNDVKVSLGLSGITLWAGVILLVASGSGTDLAVIGVAPSSLPLRLGITLTLVGVGLVFAVLNKWSWTLEGSLAMRGYLSSGAWIASTVALTRLSAWLDVSFGAWTLIVGILGTLALVAGSLGLLFSTRLTRFCHWFVLAQAGFSLVALDLGVAALLPLLLHLATGSIALVLSLLAVELSSSEPDLGLDELSGLSIGRFSRAALALVWLSFASLPPFPGFVSKFPIFVVAAAHERMGLLAVLLISTLLVAVGCTRWMSRVLRAGPAPGSRRPGLPDIAVTALAVGFTLALGALPEPAIQAAMRAVSGLF